VENLFQQLSSASRLVKFSNSGAGKFLMKNYSTNFTSVTKNIVILKLKIEKLFFTFHSIEFTIESILV
jgi:hypothetical protein